MNVASEESHSSSTQPGLSAQVTSTKYPLSHTSHHCYLIQVTKTREAEDHVEYTITVCQALHGERPISITLLTRYSKMESLVARLQSKASPLSAEWPFSSVFDKYCRVFSCHRYLPSECFHFKVSGHTTSRTIVRSDVSARRCNRRACDRIQSSPRSSC